MGPRGKANASLRSCLENERRELTPPQFGSETHDLLDYAYVKADGAAGEMLHDSPDGRARALDAKGVSVSVAKGGRDLTFERRSTSLRVNGVKLSRGYSMAGIAGALGLRAALELENVVEESMDS